MQLHTFHQKLEKSKLPYTVSKKIYELALKQDLIIIGAIIKSSQMNEASIGGRVDQYGSNFTDKKI